MNSADYIKTSNLPWELKELVTANLFPKLLFMHRTITINPDANDIVSFVYKLDTLDYLDRFTSNPIVYDIYVRKVVVTEVTGLFWEVETDKEFLEYEKIVINTMDSLTNNGAKFYFKISSDVKTIKVKYATLADWLGNFGAYTAIFSLIGNVLAGFFTDHTLNEARLNSIFKFNRNKKANYSKDFLNFNVLKKEAIFDKEVGETKVMINKDENQKSDLQAIKEEGENSNSSNSAKFKRALLINIKKKRENKEYYVSLMDILKMAWCRKLFSRDKRKFEIIDKCIEVIEDSLSVEKIIRSMFELTLMKKLFFTKYERALLKYQIRYVNFENVEQTEQYLEELVGEDVDMRTLEKMRGETVNEFEDHLLKNMEEFYGF